jgi:hypothetical protein
MKIESLFKDLKKDGWDLRIGGYMKSEYCISDVEHNGIAIFIEEPENNDTFNITCKKWKSLSVELYDLQKISKRELPKNYLEYINNIASIMYKKGLMKYNLNKIQEDF